MTQKLTPVSKRGTALTPGRFYQVHIPVHPAAAANGHKAITYERLQFLGFSYEHEGQVEIAEFSEGIALDTDFLNNEIPYCQTATEIKSIQTITDIIIRTTDGKLVQCTHRDSQSHQVGGNASLISEGNAISRYCSDIQAEEWDVVDILDYMGQIVGTGIVAGKSVRLWDMAAPMGKRLISQASSENFSQVLNSINQASK